MPAAITLRLVMELFRDLAYSLSNTSSLYIDVLETYLKSALLSKHF